VQAELVDRARHGDREAFGAVDRLYAIARLILRDTDLAEDATQDALVRGSSDMNTIARFATAAAAVTVVGAIGYAILGLDRTPDRGGVPALPGIVITEANVPFRLTVHRTVRGVEALRTSGVVPADVVGLVDAIETSFDGDEDHEGDHEDLYVTFGSRLRYRR
jgi:hypothetical protein